MEGNIENQTTSNSEENDEYLLNNTVTYEWYHFNEGKVIKKQFECRRNCRVSILNELYLIEMVFNTSHKINLLISKITTFIN